MKETFGKIWVKIKAFSFEVFAFLTSKIFMKNFAGIMAMMLAFLFFTTTWLKCYTNHNEGIHMANFVGMNLLDVKDYAKKQKFELVVDSIDLPNVPALTVTKQNPKPDALVKEKRTVYLTVVKISRDLVKLPRMGAGLEGFQEYSKLLKQRDLIPVRKTKVNSRLSQGTILEVIYNDKDITDAVKDGNAEKIPTGSKIVLVVSEKGYGNVRVPNLICKKLNEAKLILENSNINVGTIEYHQNVTDKENAYVWLQDPVEGSSIRFGEQVKLRATQYQPDNCEENEVEAPNEVINNTNDSDSNEEEENEDF